VPAAFLPEHFHKSFCITAGFTGDQAKFVQPATAHMESALETPAS